jgi:hypothetical protein
MPATEQAPQERADLAETARLLRTVFPIEKFSDARYLEWFYRQNPVGPAIEIDRADNGTRVGHVGGILQEYHSTSGVRRSVFPLNLAVLPRGRGRGLMTEMNEACFDEARRIYGIDMMVGMPNAASTPGYIGRLRFRLVTPLPVELCPPRWPTTPVVESRPVTREYLESDEFARLSSSLDLSPGRGLSHRWTPSLLKWRLASPAASYTVHASPEAVIVTCVEHRAGIRIAVVLKTFRRGGSARIGANGIIAAACRHHHAAVALYAGFSATAHVVGVPLPSRLKPAPLNLIVRRYDDRNGEPDPRLETFELFDFDAF